ncbi:hypothetical protein MPSI1_000403 [Malassezia psittaci]|uniref:Splicing factor Cactin n=1 Tax=Malassezia psittaci TaxID=1821823 RepID=A0AAF0FBI9_9BASI|nr:hypothetical protein MPSI1_000403 [Malassezia psittaci]
MSGQDLDDGRSAKRSRIGIESPNFAGHHAGPTSIGNQDGMGETEFFEPFYWRKKELQEKRTGLSRDEIQRRDSEKRADAMREMERLNAQRAQREREYKARTAQNSSQFHTDSSAVREWVAKEDQFDLEQMKLRAKIRMREGRAKPIDILVLNWMWADPERQRVADDDEDAGLESDLSDVPRALKDLSLTGLEEIKQEILTFVKLERDAETNEYWRNALIVCDDRIQKLQSDRDTRHADASILAETDAMLSSKSAEELLQLQRQIREKLRSGEPLDVEYWENLLHRIVVWRSVAKLNQVHAAVQKHRVSGVAQRQRNVAKRHTNELAQECEKSDDTEESGPDTWTQDMEPTLVKEQNLSYEQRKLPIVTLVSQWSAILAARRSVLRTTHAPRAETMRKETENKQESAEDRLFRLESEREMNNEEETFNQDVELPTKQHYHWTDKYRPRKPRYFNRVHTGYEWNRYNQTHYDSENPPPKVVQGYKFNIFYPDLIDASRPPTYKILREDSNDTVLLRFSAGPPYEDIAFRIVDRAWEFSHRRGFRCVFERGVLQLHCTSESSLT